MDEWCTVTNQVRAFQNTEKEEATNDGSGHLVRPYAADDCSISIAMVCLGLFVRYSASSIYDLIPSNNLGPSRLYGHC